MQRLYEEYAEQVQLEYYFRLSGKFRSLGIVRLINKITRYKFINNMYSKNEKMAILNIIECESHRELLCQMLRH